MEDYDYGEWRDFVDDERTDEFADDGYCDICGAPNVNLCSCDDDSDGEDADDEDEEGFL